MAEKHLFKVWASYKCEKVNLFKQKTFKDDYEFIVCPTYCFESEIMKKYEDSEEMKRKELPDWNSWTDWKVISAELKYKEVDSEFSFSELSRRLSAKEFLQYCKDNMITTVIMAK